MDNTTTENDLDRLLDKKLYASFAQSLHGRAAPASAEQVARGVAGMRGRGLPGSLARTVFDCVRGKAGDARGVEEEDIRDTALRLLSIKKFDGFAVLAAGALHDSRLRGGISSRQFAEGVQGLLDAENGEMLALLFAAAPQNPNIIEHLTPAQAASAAALLSRSDSFISAFGNMIDVFHACRPDLLEAVPPALVREMAHAATEKGLYATRGALHAAAPAQAAPLTPGERATELRYLLDTRGTESAESALVSWSQAPGGLAGLPEELAADLMDKAYMRAHYHSLARIVAVLAADPAPAPSLTPARVGLYADAMEKRGRGAPFCKMVKGLGHRPDLLAEITPAQAGLALDDIAGTPAADWMEDFCAATHRAAPHLFAEATPARLQTCMDSMARHGHLNALDRLLGTLDGTGRLDGVPPPETLGSAVVAALCGGRAPNVVRLYDAARNLPAYRAVIAAATRATLSGSLDDKEQLASVAAALRNTALAHALLVSSAQAAPARPAA